MPDEHDKTIGFGAFGGREEYEANQRRAEATGRDSASSRGDVKMAQALEAFNLYQSRSNRAGLPLTRQPFASHTEAPLFNSAGRRTYLSVRITFGRWHGLPSLSKIV